MANDFRGFVQNVAPQYLDYVGNDVNGQGTTGINTSKLRTATDPLRDSNAYNNQVAAIEALYGNYIQNILGGGSGQLLGVSTTGTSGQNGAGRSTAKPVDLSSYDQSINATQAQLNNLQPTLDNSLNTVAANYMTTLNDLNKGKAQADQSYQTTDTTNRQDYVGAKNTINTNTGQTINSLGHVIRGGQSAGDYAALLAAGQGTQQRTQAGTTFGKNQQNLDTTYHNYVDGYNTNVHNNELKRQNEENSTRAQDATSRANLLQSLASIVNERTSAAGGTGTAASQGYVDQAKNYLAQAAQYGHVTPIAAVTPTTYNAPTLDHYTATPNAAPTAANAGAAADSAGTYLGMLQAQKDKQKQLTA